MKRKPLISIEDQLAHLGGLWEKKGLKISVTNLLNKPVSFESLIVGHGYDGKGLPTIIVDISRAK
jgi:hypothetical protein